MLTGIWHILACQAPGRVPFLCVAAFKLSTLFADAWASSAEGKPKVPYLLVADEDLILMFLQPIC